MQKDAYRILIADADQEQLLMLKNILEREELIVITAESGRELVEKANKYYPHIILLEVMLPGIDGIEACYELRNYGLPKETIIAFYTERDEDYSQVAAFNAGADDYILKPVKSSVLAMRVKAWLRRREVVEMQPAKRSSELKIDRERYIVVVDGKVITLPRKEFELLSLLHSSPRKVFTRAEISRMVWGFDMKPGNRTIDVHVRKLREKLGERHIKTVKGIGYSLEF